MYYKQILLLLSIISFSFVAVGMDMPSYRIVIPVSITNNSQAYAVTVLKGTHHQNGCYYSMTLHTGQTFPLNEHTANGLTHTIPFMVITQKGPYFMVVKNKDNTPIFSIHREGPTQAEEVVGQEIIKEDAWFRIEAAVEQDGSLSYVKKECSEIEAFNSEYYGKIVPVKNWGF